MYRILRGGSLALVLAFALAACNRPPEGPPPPCPQILVPRETASATQFAEGPGRDLTDVVFEARVDRFSGFCETDIDYDDKTGEVEVELYLFFDAVRGPANTSRQGKLSYYVAIADKEENILQRRVFDSDVVFEGNRHRLQVREELTQTIPLSAGQLGDDFRIYVGLQLSEEQLEFNRNKRVD